LEQSDVEEYIDVYNYSNSTKSERGVAEWRTGMDAETKLRQLAKHPIYTIDGLVMDFIADYHSYYDDVDYEVVDLTAISEGVQAYREMRAELPDWYDAYYEMWSTMPQIYRWALLVDVEGTGVPLYFSRNRSFITGCYIYNGTDVSSVGLYGEDRFYNDDGTYYDITEKRYEYSTASRRLRYHREGVADDGEVLVYDAFYQLEHGVAKPLDCRYTDGEDADGSAYQEYIDSFGTFDHTVTAEDFVYKTLIEAYRAYAGL
jgi:hypothetical protein